MIARCGAEEGRTDTVGAVKSDGAEDPGAAVAGTPDLVAWLGLGTFGAEDPTSGGVDADMLASCPPCTPVVEAEWGAAPPAGDRRVEEADPHGTSGVPGAGA